MLSKSFIHINGIGPRKERLLWESGATSWDTLLFSESAISLPKSINRPIHEHLHESVASLERYDGGFFEERMPACEMWRLYPAFKEKTVFLDIETTGLSPGADEITVISLFDSKGVRALVKGEDLAEFPQIISQYSLLVTYNGKCFDLPFLHAHFPHFQKKYAHLDLRYPLARLGFSGGLKGVERKVGIQREGALSLVDGFMAVSLWQEHQKGNRQALDTLRRYALEDVVNLKPLLELVYNRNIKRLPIRSEEIQPEPLPRIDIPYDAQLIKRLAGEWI